MENTATSNNTYIHPCRDDAFLTFKINQSITTNYPKTQLAGSAFIKTWKLDFWMIFEDVSGQTRIT